MRRHLSTIAVLSATALTLGLPLQTPVAAADPIGDAIVETTPSASPNDGATPDKPATQGVPANDETPRPSSDHTDGVPGTAEDGGEVPASGEPTAAPTASRQPRPAPRVIHTAIVSISLSPASSLTVLAGDTASFDLAITCVAADGEATACEDFQIRIPFPADQPAGGGVSRFGEWDVTVNGLTEGFTVQAEEDGWVLTPTSEISTGTVFTVELELTPPNGHTPSGITLDVQAIAQASNAESASSQTHTLTVSAPIYPQDVESWGGGAFHVGDEPWLGFRRIVPDQHGVYLEDPATRVWVLSIPEGIEPRTDTLPEGATWDGDARTVTVEGLNEVVFSVRVLAENPGGEFVTDGQFSAVSDGPEGEWSTSTSQTLTIEETIISWEMMTKTPDGYVGADWDPYWGGTAYAHAGADPTRAYKFRVEHYKAREAVNYTVTDMFPANDSTLLFHPTSMVFYASGEDRYPATVELLNADGDMYDSMSLDGWDQWADIPAGVYGIRLIADGANGFGADELVLAGYFDESLNPGDEVTNTAHFEGEVADGVTGGSSEPTGTWDDDARYRMVVAQNGVNVREHDGLWFRVGEQPSQPDFGWAVRADETGRQTSGSRAAFLADYGLDFVGFEAEFDKTPFFNTKSQTRYLLRGGEWGRGFTTTFASNRPGVYQYEMLVGWPELGTDFMCGTDFDGEGNQVPAQHNTEIIDSTGILGDEFIGQELKLCKITVDVTVLGNGYGFSIGKQVQAADSGGWVNAPGIVTTEDTASYLLRWTNTGGSMLNDVVMYDMLPASGDLLSSGQPRNSTVGAFLTGSVANHSGWDVQVTDAANPCRPEVKPSNPGCTEDAWVEWGGIANGDVTSLRLTKSGEFNPGDSLWFEYQVEVPDYEANSDLVAWNTVSAQAGELRAVESTKVGIGSIDEFGIVNVRHVLLDADGDPVEGDPYSIVPMEGQTGFAYEAQPVSIEGYHLAATPEDATGVFPAPADGPITVTFTYAQDIGELTVEYRDGNDWAEIADATSQSGQSGSAYEITPPGITNYSYSWSSGGTTGQFPGDGQTTTVTLIYYRNSGYANVHHVEVGEDGTYQDLTWDSWDWYQAGDSYEYTPGSLEGRHFVGMAEDSAPAADVFPSDGGTIEVIFVYEQDQGTIVTRHVDAETGEEIAESDTQTGNSGSEYHTTQGEISLYHLTGQPENEEGVFPAHDVTEYVTYEYTHDRGTLIVRHLDRATGEALVTETSVEGLTATPYALTATEINGYHPVVSPENAAGVFPAEGETTTITFEYDHDRASVTARHGYLDGGTWVDLATAVTQEGETGIGYTTSAITVPGWSLTQTPSNASGTFGPDHGSETIVRWVYARDLPAPTEPGVPTVPTPQEPDQNVPILPPEAEGVADESAPAKDDETGATQEGQLAFTGMEAIPTIGVATCLLGSGVLLLLARRRRKA